jgi:hypothetical protein
MCNPTGDVLKIASKTAREAEDQRYGPGGQEEELEENKLDGLSLEQIAAGKTAEHSDAPMFPRGDSNLLCERHTRRDN